MQLQIKEYIIEKAILYMYTYIINARKTEAKNSLNSKAHKTRLDPIPCVCDRLL